MPDTLQDILTPRFEACIVEVMARHKVPGCAIAMVRPRQQSDGASQGVAEGMEWDEVIKCYGDVTPGGKPVTPETRFPIASNTKLFTVLALLQLLTTLGKDFNSRVIDLTPDFELFDKEAQETCTVGDLCAHVTGLPGYDWILKPGQTLEDLITLIPHLKPTVPIRTTHQYNNVSYGLLGLIIQRLSGASYAEYLKKAIFEPLGMDSASFEVDELTSPGHWTDGNGVRPGKQRAIYGASTMCLAGLPSGGLVLNIKDMLKWLKFFPSHPDYPIAATPYTATPGWGDYYNYPYSTSTTTYGAGLYQCTYRGAVVQEAWGYFDGIRAQVAYVADKGTRWAVMTNGDGGEDLYTLVKMVLLDEMLGGGSGIGPEAWLEKIMTERERKVTARHARYAPIPGIPSPPPLLGTFTSPGFDTWHLTPAHNLPSRPQLSDGPWAPSWCGTVEPRFTALGGGRYACCMEEVIGGEVFYGKAFNALVEGEGKGRKLFVYGLSDVAERMDSSEYPIEFTCVE
ncbi:hypothetical protein IAT38_003852 [Cryptococcus sp. DSM 104549]